MPERLKPGAVRDAITAALQKQPELSVGEIIQAVEQQLGRTVAASSVRSYLNLNVGQTFERVRHGRYRLKGT